MARKRNVTVKKGLDGWVMTYGDMMSLLLTFFVLIVSFSSMQEAKFEQAVESLRQAFGVMAMPESVIELSKPLVPENAPSDVELEFLYEVRDIEKMVLDQELDTKVEVEIREDGVLFSLPSPLLFASGAAELRDESRPLLDRLARMFRKFPGEVRIEGHTDSVPMRSARFPTNWELSAARAVSVARNFQGLGIPPGRLAAVGYGEHRPLAENGTAAGRAENRRVEILLAWQSRKVEPRQELPLERTAAPLETAPTTAPAPARVDTAGLVPRALIVDPVTGRLGAAVNPLRK